MPDKKYLIDFPDAPDSSAVWEADKWERNKDAFMSEYKDSDVNVFELEDYNPEDVKEHDQIMISFDDNPDGSAVWDSAKWERNKDAFMAENPTAKIQRVRYNDYWGERATANREQRAALLQQDEDRNARLADLGYYDDLSENQMEFNMGTNLGFGLEPLSSAIETSVVTGQTKYLDPAVQEFFANDSAYTDRMAEIARLDAEYESNPAVIAQREWEAQWRAEQAKYNAEYRGNLQGDIDALETTVDASKAGRGDAGKRMSPKYGMSAYVPTAEEMAESEKRAKLVAARTFLEKANIADQSAGKGFWGAAGDTAKGWALDSATQGDVDTYNKIGDILTNLEKEFGGLGEEQLTDEVLEQYLSPEDKLLILSFFNYNEAMANAQVDMKRAYKAGKIFAESVPFMLEFLVTGGFASAGSAATKGTTKAIEKGIAKALVKWVTKKSAKKATRMAVARGLQKTATGLMGAATGTLARTLASHGTYNRMAEESVKIEGGHLHRGKNAFKAFADAYIENLSEISGGVIGKTLGNFGVNPSKWLGKISFGKVGQLLADNRLAQGIAKGIKGIFGEKGVLKKFGFNGIFEEVEEEYIGNLIREYTIQDGALAEMHKDGNFGAMLIGFAPMTLFGAGISAVQMGAVNIEAANLGKKLRETLGYHYSEEQINHMMNLVEKAENGDQVMQAITPLMDGLTKEEGQQLLQYGAFMAQNKAMIFARKAQEDNLAQAKRAEFQQQYGNFWQSSEEGAESVQIAEIKDSSDPSGKRTVFVTTAPNENGTVAIVDAKTGKLGFSNVSEYVEQKDKDGNTSPMTRTWSMDAFLESQIARDRMTAQEARMTREYNEQVQNLQSQITSGTKINLGTTGNPIWMVATGQTSKDGVFAVDSTGATHTIGWMQVADAMNQPIRVKTDQEIIDEEVAAVVSRNAERRKKMRNATPAMTDAVNESAAQTAEVVAQESKHIPMNEDGTVNEAAFWEQDPEGYAAWNDEQNQDGGADTREQIAISKAMLTQMLGEAVAAQQNSNPAVRKQAKQNAADIQAQIDRLTALEAKYEEQRIAPFRERAMKWKGLTNAPVHIIETEEELAKISAEAAEASGKKSRVRGMAKDGKAYIYLPGITEASEIDAVFMHEAVAHTGLKGMLGQQAFDELCDQVWEMMSPEARQVFIGYPGVNGNKRAAADEYIAHIAERMGAGVATAEEKTIWQKIVDFVRNVLRAMGVDINVSESELADLLQLAYKDLAKNMAEAEKIAKQNAAATEARRDAPTAAKEKYDEYLTKGLTAEEIKAGAQNEFDNALKEYNDLQAQAPKVEMGESVEDFIARKKAYNDKLAKAKALLDEKQTMMDEIARREKPADDSQAPEVVEDLEQTQQPDGSIRLSMVTYNDWTDNLGNTHKGTRTQVIERMIAMNFSDAERNEMLAKMDTAYEYMEKLRSLTNEDGSVRFDEFNAWAEKTPLYKQVGRDYVKAITSLVSNGDYPINMELTTDCIKREAFTMLLNTLVKRGADLSKMGPGEIVTIQKMMNQYGIEVACKLCFVEGKRLQIVNWASQIVEDWNNALVEAGVTTDEYFEFGKDGDAFIPAEEWRTHENKAEVAKMWRQLDEIGLLFQGIDPKQFKRQQAKNKKAVAEYRKKEAEKWAKKNKRPASEWVPTEKQESAMEKMAKEGLAPTYVNENMEEYRNAFNAMRNEWLEQNPGADPLSFTPTKKQWEALGKIRNRQIDTVRAKMVRLIMEYPEMRKKMTLNDLLGSKGLMEIRQQHGQAYADLYSIILQRFGTGTPKPVQDAVPYDGELMTLSEAAFKKANEIGGARLFSFSDFDITKVFDYMQMFFDLEANKQMLQSYTKEVAAVIIFGRSNAKFNISTLANAYVPQEVLEEYAKAKEKRQKEMRHKWAENAGLLVDEAGNITGINFSEEHSVSPAFAQQIFHDDARNKDCGAIMVGASVNHAIYSAAQAWIRMVIPFHLSGMPKAAQDKTDVKWYFDNTPYQSTRKKTSDGWAKISSSEDTFKFYDDMNAPGWNMRDKTKQYLAWCADKGFRPKFDWGINSDYYRAYCEEMGYEPNQQIIDIMDADTTDGVWNQYYKFLTDFTAYKPVFNEQGEMIDEIPSPQLPVQSNFDFSEMERDVLFEGEKSMLGHREENIKKAERHMDALAAQVVSYLNGEITEGEMGLRDDVFYKSSTDAENYLEEIEKQMEANKAVPEWFKNIRRSQELDQNNSPFILAPDGGIDFGEILPIHHLPAAPIRLSEGDAENGYIHINNRHGKEIQKQGFNSIEDFVKFVVDNFTRIQEGSAYENETGGQNQTYLVQLQDKHNNTLFIQLSRDGQYWNVNSAGVFKKNYGNNRKNIWSASEVQNDNSAVVDNGLQSEPNADTGSTSNGTPSDVSESKDSENPEIPSEDARFSARTDEQREALFDKAKAQFGLTNNFKVAGYMLPDGSLLDFSEANDGGDPNQRSLDHREIEGIIMDEGKEYDSRWMYLADFMNEGAIRLLPEYAGINLMKAPTKEQRSRLFDFIYKYNGEVILEIADERLNNVAYVEYDRRTSPSRIFRDIDGYFNEGIVPQQDVRFSVIGEVGALRDKTPEGIARLENLDVARQMESQLNPDWTAKENEAALKIKVATGWERGADGLWRYEVEDVKVKPVKDWVNSKKKLMLGDILEDNIILQLYPDLADITIVKGRGKTDWGAVYFAEEQEMKLPFGAVKYWQDAVDTYGEKYAKKLQECVDTMVSDIIHEVQHAIQHREGFAAGGNPDMIIDPEGQKIFDNLLKEFNDIANEYNAMDYFGRASSRGKSLKREAQRKELEINLARIKYALGMQGYKKLGGETEARNAETRQGWTDEQRRNTLLASTEDVAREDQTFIFREAKRIEGELRFSVSNESQAVFVSNAARAVEGIKMEKATPTQWLAMIEKNGGLKAGEDKWMGLSDFLKASDKKTLTKAEVLDFIGEHMIRIEDTHYLADIDFDEEEQMQIDAMNEEFLALRAEAEAGGEWIHDAAEIAYQVMADKYGDDFTIGFGVDMGKLYVSNLEAASAITGIAPREERVINETRLGYTTDGLTNKREIALTVPTIEPWNTHDDIHFGDAGDGRAVAWIRFGETTDESGNRILVIDEIQSKRHQEGREQGYKVSREKADAEMDKFMKQMHDKYDFSSSTPFAEVFNEEEMREFARLSMQQHRATFGTTSVPDAPFEKNWHELAMKRMLRYAAEEGYDAIAWTKGEQQAERYNIGNVVEEISLLGWRAEGKDFLVRLNESDTLYEINTSDDAIIESASSVFGDVNGKPLSDIVGKEMADKMMSMHEDEKLAGEELRVGGEGMKGFYDKMLPAFMNKYGKKWGIKVADITLPNVEEAGRVMHSVPVTEEMKKSVMEGQVMFSAVQIDPAVRQEMDTIKAKAMWDGTFMKAPNGADTKLTEEQWLLVRTKNFLNWFGDWINDPANASKIVDENGEPMVVYHGSPYGAITQFDRRGHSVSGLKEFGTYFSTSKELAQLYAYARQQAKGDVEKYELEKARLDAIIFDNETPARIALDAFDELDRLEESQKPRVYEVFLNIRKPKVFDAGRSNGWDGWHKLKQDVGYDIKSGVEAIEAISGHNRAARMNETYDGIIAKNIADVHSEASEDLMGDVFLVFDETPENIKSATETTGQFSESGDIRFSAVAEAEEVEPRFSVVTDPALLDKLDNEEYITLYRAMQVVDGGLYQPMAGKVAYEEGEEPVWGDPIPEQTWLQSDETPWNAVHARYDKATKDHKKGDLKYDKEGNPVWVFKLNKGNGKSLYANYNPYIHTSFSPLNDQFSEAQDRENLVVVRVLVPKSELTSGYKAEKAHDAVGTMPWHSGPISGVLAQYEGKERVVMLTRYAMIDGIVPWTEVADEAMKLFEDTELLKHPLPTNVFMKGLREELESRGVQFVKTDNGGEILEGEHKGKTWAKVYGKDGLGKKPKESKKAKKAKKSDIRFSAISTPTDNVVAEGMKFSIQDFARLAGNIFQDMPESFRKEAIEETFKRGWDMQSAIFQIPARLAEKENWDEADKDLAKVIREKVQDAMDESGVVMSRPLTTKEALWMLYRSTEANSDSMMDAAKRSIVAHNLGFDSRSMALKEKADDYIRYSVVRSGQIDAATDMYNYEANLWTNRLKESWLDMNQSVIALQNALADASGKPIASWENVVLALNQLSSKSYAEKKKYLRDYLMPLWNQIIEITKESGLSIEQIERYMMLKHGLERNKKFAMRDAKQFYREMYDKVADRMKNTSHAEQVVALSEANKRIADIDAQIAAASGKKLKDLQEARERAVVEKEIAELVLRNDELQNEADLQMYFDAIEAESNPKYAEFREKDYGGLTSMFMDKVADVKRSDYKTDEAYQAALLESVKPRFDKVADMEAEADMEVKDYESKADMPALWKLVNAATKETLRHQHAAGVITTEQYDVVRNMFDYYVPLRGFADNTAEDMYSYYMNNSAGGFAKPIIAAKGRKTRAESPLGWIGTMAESAIQQDNKNEVKMKLYYALMNRPDTGVLSLSEMWYVYDHTDPSTGRKVFVPAYPPATGGVLTADQIRQHMDTWEQSMKAKQAIGEAYKREQGVNLGGSVIFQDKAQDAEHIIRVKVAGKDYAILVNGNPRAAQAINGLLNPDANVGPVREWYGALRRGLSALMTSFSPLFWVANYQRDLLSSFMRTSLNEGWGQAFKYLVNRFHGWKAAKYIYRYDKGKMDNSYYDTLYKEFAENGGITGYTSLTTNKEYEKLLADYAGNVDKEMLNWIKGVWDKFMGFGEAIEQVSRFAAYITARESGKSIEEAVAAAKEVSVNFNRKGSTSPISLDELEKLRDKNGKPLSMPKKAMAIAFSAMPSALKELYFFFNASIQALSSSAKLARKSPGKAMAWAGMYMGLSVGLAFLNYLLAGDDDDNDFLDLPDYLRHSTALFKMGDKYYGKWSLPQEMRPFYATADILVSKIMGKTPHKTAWDTVGDIALAAAEWLPVNPFGTEDPILALVPDVAAPLAEIKANQNSFGGRIYNDMSFKSEDVAKQIPAYRKGTSKTGEIYVDMAEFLNDITGGDEVQKGIINLNPAMVEHLVEGYGGGIYDFGKMIVGIPGLIYDAVWGEGVEVRDIPFVNKILLSTDETNMNSHVNEAFYHYQGIADNAKRVENEYRKSDDPSRADDYMAEDDWRIYMLFRQYEEDLKMADEKVLDAVDDTEKELAYQEQNVIREMLLNDITRGVRPSTETIIKVAVESIRKESNDLLKPSREAERKLDEAKRRRNRQAADAAKREFDSLRDLPEYKKGMSLKKDLDKIKRNLDKLQYMSPGTQRDSVLDKVQRDYDALLKKARVE